MNTALNLRNSRATSFVLPVCAVFATVSCAEQHGAAPPRASTDLRKSAVCSISSPQTNALSGDAAPLAIVITMKNNDGGWCWHSRMTQIGSQLFGVKMHVVRQAHHGEVVVTVLERSTRIAYRPNPGFFGTDEF